MADFILRVDDDDLWRQFRERAQAEGRTMRWILIALIQHYLAHGLPTTIAKPQR